MLARRRIRSQMYFAVSMIVVIVGVLSIASLNGSMKFRQLTKSIRGRATELPLAANLGIAVSDLRSQLWKYKSAEHNGSYQPSFIGNTITPISFLSKLDTVSNALADYRMQLEMVDESDSLIADHSPELEFVASFEAKLGTINQIVQQGNWVFDAPRYIQQLEDELEQLQRETSQLPGFLNDRMDEFANNARLIYRTWIWLTAALTGLTFLFTWLLYHRFNVRIFQPLETLVNGSRIVARGDFDYRIQLETNDEVAELADALNAMTSNFQTIKSDLNRQVQQRTKEVVRSEKMASVGFLAAGVAHEINNPLATIAWSAESLESRIQDILQPSSKTSTEQYENDVAQMKKYLRRIQEEAFRCKGITSGLLDFSRMGDAKKGPDCLNEIVESVIEMVKPLSKYRDKNIHFQSDQRIHALLNSQEIKQVALNLITNALGSVEPGGVVEVELSTEGESAVLKVRDNGCGMTPDIIRQLFEPFFTRRRDGQGTGLGLSITYQIIQDHNGKIVPHSDGPGKGSTFTVSLPLVKHEQNRVARAA